MRRIAPTTWDDAPEGTASCWSGRNGGGDAAEGPRVQSTSGRRCHRDGAGLLMVQLFSASRGWRQVFLATPSRLNQRPSFILFPPALASVAMPGFIFIEQESPGALQALVILMDRSEQVINTRTGSRLARHPSGLPPCAAISDLSAADRAGGCWRIVPLIAATFDRRGWSRTG